LQKNEGGVVEIFWDRDGRLESLSHRQCCTSNIETFKPAESEKLLWVKSAKKRLDKRKWVGAVVFDKKTQVYLSAVIKAWTPKNVTCSYMANVNKKVRAKWSRIFRPLFPPGSEVMVPRSKRQKGKQSLDSDYELGKVMTRDEHMLYVQVGMHEKAFKFCDCIPCAANNAYM